MTLFAIFWSPKIEQVLVFLTVCCVCAAATFAVQMHIEFNRQRVEHARANDGEGYACARVCLRVCVVVVIVVVVGEI